MAVDLQNRLLTVEQDLIDSLEVGTLAALRTFETSWSTLLDSVQVQTLDVETSALAHSTATRVENLATALLELQSEVTAVRTGLMTELEDVFGELDLNDRSDVSQRPKPPPSQASLPSSTSPPYLAPACKWLLKNIHNPYPSKETKELISRGTGTSIQNVDAWFLNVRRRIGWTSLCKRYFNGSKTDTVAAAYRALVPEEQQMSGNGTDRDQEYTPLPANVMMAFVEIEDAAKAFYKEKFTKSNLAGRLDGMIKDMTHNDKERRKEARRREKLEERLQEKRTREAKKEQEGERRWQEAKEGYPSPEPESLGLSFEFETPDPVGADDEEDLTSPPPIAGRKRASSEESTDDRAIQRPTKRSRMLSSSSSCSSVDSTSSVSRQHSLEPFPSSPSSTACSTPPPSTPSEDTSTSLPQQDAPSKRKRRLSDADAEPRPKRPMPLVRPRLQVVSDPLPKSVPSASRSTPSPSPVDEPAILDWSQFFNQHFMAVTDEVDTTGPIKMDMFDYSQFADYVSSGETSDGTDWEAQCEPFKSKGLLDPISQSSSPAIHVPSLSTFTDFDLPAPVSVLPEFELDFCATMGWPYVGTIPSKPTSTGSTLEDTELNKLDGLSSLATLPPYEPGLSSASEASCSNEGGFDIDWSSIIPQTIPPAQPVVSSLLTATNVATISPSAYLGSSAESRAEKLRKYQEHLAQARRLHEELAFV